ncbi:MAG: PHP domain-containing protein [Dehalococcoidia bacterium]|nr:PHP domain-containing protein [Dehalococcoidia bacterium]
MLRADLHVHTCYSMDCETPLNRIIDSCRKASINCIAVSDHGTVAGALKLKEIAPFEVIVAQEILTPFGELMGLFLSEDIPSGLSPGEAIARIRSQGGVVNIPHPFGRSLHLRRGSKQNVLLSGEILSQIDMIEVLNSRTPFSSHSTRARELAVTYGLGASAGSDAHTAGEIGRAYVEMPEFTGAGDFVACLKQGTIHGKSSSPLIHLTSTWAKVRKRVMKGGTNYP